MGRPLTGNERKRRYQIMLEPADADDTREQLGGGNLSRGVQKAIELAIGQRISKRGVASKAKKAKKAKERK